MCIERKRSPLASASKEINGRVLLHVLRYTFVNVYTNASFDATVALYNVNTFQ